VEGKGGRLQLLRSSQSLDFQGFEVLKRLVKRGRTNAANTQHIAEHAFLLSQHNALHDQAERLLQVAIDICAPAPQPPTSTTSASVSRLSPTAALEYAHALKRYFDFLIGVRSDLKQCAEIIVLLHHLHQDHGAPLPDDGGGVAGDGGRGTLRDRLKGGEISVVFFISYARLQWALTRSSRGRAEEVEEEDGGEEEEGDYTQFLQTTEHILHLAYALATQYSGLEGGGWMG
jgi:hypothetical protein